MDHTMVTTVGDMFGFFGAVLVLLVVAAALAYRAGIEVGRTEGADERAALKLELRLLRDGPDVFVDLAGRFGIGTPEEVTK